MVHFMIVGALLSNIGIPSSPPSLSSPAITTSLWLLITLFNLFRATLFLNNIHNSFTFIFIPKIAIILSFLLYCEGKSTIDARDRFYQ